MSKMLQTVIADTSCFIILTNINELELLQKTYGQIVTTPEIAIEYGMVLPDWVQIVAVSIREKQQLLKLQLGEGESSAIALAIETSDANIILDDYKARKIAMQLGLDVTGTVGVIIKAKLNGIIPSVKPILEKITTEASAERAATCNLSNSQITNTITTPKQTIKKAGG